MKLVWRYRERDGVGETQELSKCKTDSETNSQMDERDRGLADVREKGRLSSLFFFQLLEIEDCQQDISEFKRVRL